MPRAIVFGLILLVLAGALAAEPAAKARLNTAALAAFERERLRVPLLRLFDADGRQVLEVRGWGDGMRPLDGLAAREPVPGRPSLPQRLTEIDGGETLELQQQVDYTALLYYADWCAVCRRMEPEFAAQVAELAPVRIQVLRIEADPLRR